MLYQQNIEAALKQSDQSLFAKRLDDTKKIVNDLKKLHKLGEVPLLDIPHQRDDLPLLRDIADRYREKFDHVFIIGTGGSSLGAQALCCLKDFTQDSPKIHFLDNIDHYTYERLFHEIDLHKVGAIVISKSGHTTETLCQFLIFISRLEKLIGHSKLKDHITIITEPKDNPLNRLGQQNNLKVIDHPLKIGGRFSVLTCVGLLPALICNINVENIRQGAQRVLEENWYGPSSSSEPCKGAALIVALWQEKKINSTVFMPYVDRLLKLAEWYRQLWAESLGKNGKGITPIVAKGTVDQHSQLQLYLDGPKNNLFTLIFERSINKGSVISADDDELIYLNNHTMGDVMDAEQRATAQSLEEHKCPTRLFLIEHLNEETLGSLIMHFTLETLFTAQFLGVNAFDQPAVEHGKKLTRELLQKR
jgi:glucose-6-phosphate isomerase